MKIGFDAKRAFLNDRGLGNYSRTIINSLTTYFDDNQYFLYTPSANLNLAGQLTQLQNLSIRTPQKNYHKWFKGSLWRSLFLGNDIAADQIDIYHGLSHELPFNITKSKSKNIVTIHDLIFLQKPHLYPFLDRLIYHKKWTHSCQVADKIIAVSQKTKQDIVDLLSIDADKIEVVYPSCDPVYYDGSDAMMLAHGFFPNEKYNILQQVPDNFILYVGAIVERKNLLNIVKALQQLNSRLQIPLVVVGKGKAYRQKVEKYIHENDLENQISFLDDISNEQLSVIYKKAELLVYPSDYEGFGLPIVEALFSHTPVIAARGTCLEETGGKDSIYIEAQNIEEMADAIERVLTDTTLAQKMSENGWQHAQQFRREMAALQTINIYKALI